MTVHLEGGKDLIIKAPKNSAKNVYVQGLRVNGKKWTSTALPHKVIAKGGVLEFDMGAKPSKWGTGADAAPVSITKDDKVPSPRADVLAGDGALFDNSSKTSAELASALNLPVPDSTRAVQYTLTSADRAKAPTGWVLEASKDGQEWKAVDRRDGESFAWDQQTRVFSVADPGTYRQYRLVPEGGAGTLAEVELIG